jgi:hypothetical protein
VNLRSALIATCLDVALVTTALHASTVVGIFAILDHAALEPDENAPQRIRLTGVFVVPVPVSSGLHKPPQRGSLCFTLPPGREDAAVQDWFALKAAAGTGQVVGFGEYWVVTARVGNSTANTSLEVNVNGLCERYPVPNKRGVVTAFDTLEDANPRFGEPSMVIVSKLLMAHQR